MEPLPPPPKDEDIDLLRKAVELADAARIGSLHGTAFRLEDFQLLFREIDDQRARIGLLVEAGAALTGALGAVLEKSLFGLSLNSRGLVELQKVLDRAEEQIAVALNTTLEAMREQKSRKRRQGHG